MRARKKTLRIFTFFLCLFLSGCYLVESRYVNREYGFSLILPRIWQKQEGLPGTILVARSPLTGAEDKFQENITVSVGDLTEEVPLDVIYELNKEEIMRVIPGVKEEILEADIYAGRIKGKSLAFINRNGESAIRTLIALWVKEKRVYVLVCSAELKDYTKYADYFRKATRSFSIQ
jgi:hypothetical protein